jgi:hypothetical protein
MTTEHGPEVEILPPEQPFDRPSFRMPVSDRDWCAAQAPHPQSRRQRAGTPGRRITRVVVLSVVGAAAAFAGWQVSYGYPGREAIAGLSPSLRWLAPEAAAPVDQDATDQARDQARSDDQPGAGEQNARLDRIARNMDRMAADLAANQAQITHLAANQEKITHEITRLKGVVQSSERSAPPRRHALYPYYFYR